MSKNSLIEATRRAIHARFRKDVGEMSDDASKTPPIEPLDYIGGVKVVDIGDIRVARGLSRRPVSACNHRKLVNDRAERRIWCSECETDVEVFDAFMSLVEQFHYAAAALELRAAEIKQAEALSIISIAAKNIDKEWRAKNTVPACPHCGNGLFPENFRNGITTLGREYAAMRLKREKEAKNRR